MFTRAITRTPASNFADGLTTVDLGVPDYGKTVAQHKCYLDALKQCGLALTELTPDPRYPDSTFVEDTAIITEHGAILTNPGAESRKGEADAIKATLKAVYPDLAEIVAPGTVDGGDICEAGTHFFIGISERTNEEGARRLSEWLSGQGCTSMCVDIRRTPGILHLKSSIAYLGDNRMVVIDALADHPAFRGYERVRVRPGEEYAANCVRVNDRVLLAAGFPAFEATIRSLGYTPLVLDMSEFQKMDGGLSCLSLRF